MIKQILETKEIKTKLDYQTYRATVKELSGAYVKVGFPAAADPASPAKRGSGKKPYADMSEVARVAVWNEFGVPNEAAAERGAKRGFMEFWKIPPRPFFRTAIEKYKEPTFDLMNRLKIDMFLGKATVTKALNMIGLFMQDKIKKQITDTYTPPNAPLTIKKKKSSHPLIDTGQMRNSVTYIVHFGNQKEPAEPDTVEV